MEPQPPDNMFEVSSVWVEIEPRADYSDLAGQWVPDPAFDEALAQQRRIGGVVCG